MSIRAAIIPGPGFQDEEFIYPYYRLLEANIQVEVATKDGAIIYGKFGVPAKATMATAALDAVNFDLVLIPGGFEGPDRVRLLPEVLDFIRELDRQKKLIAAICHGPSVLISAGVTKGRKMTGFWSIEADIKNSGAEYCHKEPVVVDGNLITSPHYNNNPEFMRAVVGYFHG